jgi:hypothetical protein
MWCPTTILILLCIYLVCEVALQSALIPGWHKRVPTDIIPVVSVGATVIVVPLFLAAQLIYFVRERFGGTPPI